MVFCRQYRMCVRERIAKCEGILTMQIAFCELFAKCTSEFECENQGEGRCADDRQ